MRVIGYSGEQLGILSISEAVKRAREQSLDLVEVSPNSEPPVCKIMDYGKYKYAQNKKIHDAKKHQTVIQIKEIKVRPNIEQHDLEFKVKHIKRFLQEGNKVKVNLVFRGREITHTETSRVLLDKITEEIGSIGVVELKPKMDKKNLFMVLAPKPVSSKKEKEPKTE